MKPVFPVFQYVINYDYISKVLCINKENVALHCNGKCYLKNELAKSSESDTTSKDKETKTNTSIEILFFKNIDTIQFEKDHFLSFTKINSRYSNLYFYLKNSYTFHPPSFSA